jgi:hypothetical protein
MPPEFVKQLAKSVLGKVISKISDFVLPYEEADKNVDVRNVRLLYPAERVHLASPHEDSFVPVGKYYKEGWFDRPPLFVCDIPEARFHVPSGLVCTRSFKAVADVGLEYRRYAYPPFNRRRPFGIKRRAGVFSSIHKYDSTNFWHWMLDCLPKLHSLAKVAPPSGITLLMPASSNEFQRETIRAVLPAQLQVEYVSKPEWIQTELFLWSSLVSDRCMGFLPQEYYDAIRGPIFKQYGLPTQHAKKERLYLSRAGAKHRRVLNEDALMNLLDQFGFRKVLAENLSFQEQVELFHWAEIVIGPHGAGIGTMFFSGNIDVVVLYPTRIPPNYFHSLALGLGQKHHFVCHDETDEDANFDADLPALRRILEQDLGLKN